jgi:predicted ribosome quality control (RQC) complex YloA/Tae2 family protein
MAFRQFTTSSGKNVLAGKNADQNDELVNQFLGTDNMLLHSALPGSPFCVIQELNPNRQDLKETAIFCASKSQDWRDNQQDVIVHVFSGKETYKGRGMKAGTFGVVKNKTIRVRKKEVMDFLKETSNGAKSN